MKPLSHSSISLYLDCPQKYKFKYIDKVPEEPRHFFSFGKSMHSALEFFYGVRMLPSPALEQVLTVYKERWISEGYKDKEQEDQYLKEGERILKEFYAKHIDRFAPPLFCEYQFRIEIEGVPVMGFVDRIDKLPNEKLAIVDYKTGKAFDLKRVEKDPQLTLYQIACRQSVGLDVETLTLYHLPSNTAFTVGKHPVEFEEEVRARVRTVSDGITKEKFEADPSEEKCQWCDYKKPNPSIGFAGCPAWRDEYLTAEEKQTTSYGTVDIESQVDAYGDLKSKIKSLEKNLDSLRKIIEKYFADKKLRKVKGQKYQLFCEFKEKWNFAEHKKELYEALKESGLWERILAPSHFAIQKLFHDEKLKDETKERLKKLGEKELSSTIRVMPTEKHND